MQNYSCFLTPIWLNALNVDLIQPYCIFINDVYLIVIFKKFLFDHGQWHSLESELILLWNLLTFQLLQLHNNNFGLPSYLYFVFGFWMIDVAANASKILEGEMFKMTMYKLKSGNAHIWEQFKLFHSGLVFSQKL